jgi:hypothetical protein
MQTMQPIADAIMHAHLLQRTQRTEICGFEELTILTPCLSALVRNTNSVERITEMRGAIADTQNSFFHF